MAIKINTYWIKVAWLTAPLIQLFTNTSNSKDQKKKDEKPQYCLNQDWQAQR